MVPSIEIAIREARYVQIGGLARPNRSRVVLWHELNAPRTQRCDTLTAIDDISVPAPKPDEVYSLNLLGETVRVSGFEVASRRGRLQQSRRSTGGSRRSGRRRARGGATVLSELTLQHLYDRPLVDDQGRVDGVMRVNYDIDREVFGSIASLTLGRTQGPVAVGFRR